MHPSLGLLGRLVLPQFDSFFFEDRRGGSFNLFLKRDVRLPRLMLRPYELCDLFFPFLLFGFHGSTNSLSKIIPTVNGPRDEVKASSHEQRVRHYTTK